MSDPKSDSWQIPPIPRQSPETDPGQTWTPPALDSTGAKRSTSISVKGPLIVIVSILVILGSRSVDWNAFSQKWNAVVSAFRGSQIDGNSTVKSSTSEQQPNQTAGRGYSHGLSVVLLQGHAAGVTSAQFSSDGKRVVTASKDKTARVWDVDSGKLLTTLEGHAAEVKSAQFSLDGERVVTASDDWTARVWDAASGKLLSTLQGLAPLVMQVSPRGTRIVNASLDRTARVWDVESGKLLATLQGHEAPVVSAQFSPDGTRIVTGSADKTARVWNADSGKLLATLQGHEEWVHGVQFSSDGTRIVTASDDKAARVWDADSGKLLAILQGHEARVVSAQFSPGGALIVTASDDKTARVWDNRSISQEGQSQSTDGDKLVATLKGHHGAVQSVQFSPDGTRIVTASTDRTARVWDVESGKLLATLQGHEDGVVSAQFSPDGKRILTSSGDKTARVWTVPASSEPPHSLRTGDNFLEALKKAQQAQLDAPACQMKMKYSMKDTGSENRTLTVTFERVRPDLIHCKMEEGGEVKSEVWSDGKKSFGRGPNGQIAESTERFDMDTISLGFAGETWNVLEWMIRFAGEAGENLDEDLKFIGHENVNGVATSIYAFQWFEMTSAYAAKLWISDADNRPLKSEGEFRPEQKTSLKSVTTWDYDPSIKVVMPSD